MTISGWILALTCSLVAVTAFPALAHAHSSSGAHRQTSQGASSQGHKAQLYNHGAFRAARRDSHRQSEARQHISRERVCHRHNHRFHCHLAKVRRPAKVAVQRGASSVSGPSTTIRLQFSN
jgi:hypothetical protein